MNVVVPDLEEAARAYEHAEITSLAVATVVYELINLVASKASSSPLSNILVSSQFMVENVFGGSHCARHTT